VHVASYDRGQNRASTFERPVVTAIAIEKR
jgi:hypothetical protein